MRFSFAMLLCLFATGAVGGEPGMSPAILDVFPPSVALVPRAQRGETIVSTRYTPSGSLWDARLDERWVFHCELRHEQDAWNSFALRIGKGGQVYSLRGPFGESVPPSWRSGSELSAWNDEVWQFVAVCERYNGLRALLREGKVPDRVATRFKNCPYKTSFFVHGSGAYTQAGSTVQYLYCPLLASGKTRGGRGYRTLNWGILPQLRTVHRSPVLFYCQTRDLGDGVIELTWVVHNFSVRGDVVFDYLNAPWGGTRVSSLPFHYVSSPSGEPRTRERLMPGNTVNVRATGGWSLWCATEAPDSPSLAFVFGRDKRLEEESRKAAEGKPHVQFQPSLYRQWRAGAPQLRRGDRRPQVPPGARDDHLDALLPGRQSQGQGHRTGQVAGGRRGLWPIAVRSGEHADDSGYAGCGNAGLRSLRSPGRGHDAAIPHPEHPDRSPGRHDGPIHLRAQRESEPGRSEEPPAL